MGIFVVYKALLLGCVVSAISLLASPASGQQERSLDELTTLIQSTQAWGALGVNTAAHAPGATPMPLRIGETVYERGLGHHASGEMRLNLEGQYHSFSAEVGVQWQGGNRGSVVFQIWVDGEKRFDSGLRSDGDPALAVEIDLTDAREMRLVALDGGDGVSCDMANWVNARLLRDGRLPEIGRPLFAATCDAEPMSEYMEGSYALIGRDAGAQFAFSRPLNCCVMISAAGEAVQLALPVGPTDQPYAATVALRHAGGAPADIRLELDGGGLEERQLADGDMVLTLSAGGGRTADMLRLSVAGVGGDAAVRLHRIEFAADGRTSAPAFLPDPIGDRALPAPRETAPHPLLLSELLEWDWRMQDGIGTPLEASTFAEAVHKVLAGGDALLADLTAQGVALGGLSAVWRAQRLAYDGFVATGLPEDDPAWEDLWREAHRLRRQIAFANPLADVGPLLFVKQAPPVFSHQLTQYYGRYARPGGGMFVLDHPGESLAPRQLAENDLPQGSFMQPEVSADGQRVVVAFCAADAPPEDTIQGAKGRYYHLYELAADGSRTRQLTDGPFDDFAAKELPNGRIMFISTRRGGWHRCGTPGCEVYTLTLMDADGGNIHTVSYHETQEWDPAVLNDGRVVYTRWDYVDRDAVHYQQLWTVRPDGTAPAAFYGNNTLNPVGVWEARAIPFSGKIMATAAAHHAMTAGSIILVDPTVGIDGLEPIARLTPDVPFPESEARVAPHWRSALAPEPPQSTAEMKRWPGHVCRSPWPLSETYFLAAYSFDPLIGEPTWNPANIFGLYLMDAFGNRELIYRDLNLSSLWPVPLRPRATAPILPSTLEPDAPPEGAYFLQNVYESDPSLPDEPITHLRIVQVLPKSTPGANNPTVGAPNASPGKQVLGTVPVEKDGSAYFRAPAGVGLAFQALDAKGQAVQIMRSVSYLQPGETASCIGCHESRGNAPPPSVVKTMAASRPPSDIAPGPDGSRPLSYPLLVQPVLDKHCVHCHGDAVAEGPPGQAPILLTGAPEGRYTQSYNALASRVSFAAWGRGPFPDGNSEPLTQPGYFGARGSALMRMLLEGHHEVRLDADDMARIITWIDANALFYGTFKPEDQERQLRGERIDGPEIE